MEFVASQTHYLMSDFWRHYGDVRTKDLFMVRNGLYEPLGVILVYFVLITQIGPRFMQNRKPFNLKWILLAYNLLMVGLNVWFFVETLLNYNYGLDMFDFDYPRSNDMSPIMVKKALMCHFYLMSKFLDLFDTVFFVLRKKQNQVTKLHLYHHMSVPLLGWIVVRVIPTNGPLVIFAILNTGIHVIMYSYYCLAALGPSVRPYLWWKKYVTLLQIYQFVIYALFSWLFAFKQRGYPIWLQVLGYTQPVIFLVLFCRFYTSSYTKKHIQTDKTKHN